MAQDLELHEELNKTFTPDDFLRSAVALGVPTAAVMAIAEVEAPNGGFDAQGFPRILFEGHVFHRNTGGKFSASHPTLSFPKWTTAHYAKGANVDVRNEREHARLAAAVALSRSAALMSASWGGLQILGENYATAGFKTLQDFVNAMYRSPGAQMDAFTEFVQHDRKGRGLIALKRAVDAGDWTPFAEFYNGAGQATHQYDKRLAAAYKKFK